MHLEVHFEDGLCRVVIGNLILVEILLWGVLGYRFFVWVVKRLITLRLGQHLGDEFTLQLLAVLDHVAKLRGRWKYEISISLWLLFSLLNFWTTCLIYLRCAIWFVDVDFKNWRLLVWWCLIPVGWDFAKHIFYFFEVLLELFIVGLVTTASKLVLLFDGGFGLVVGGPEF